MEDSAGISKEDLKARFSELSHDVRAPLATCQSFLNVLEMSDYKLSPPELEMLVLDIRDSLERSLLHIDDRLSRLRDFLDID
jgi:K+-sensing histidine kinase KdpD